MSDFQLKILEFSGHIAQGISQPWFWTYTRQQQTKALQENSFIHIGRAVPSLSWWESFESKSVMAQFGFMNKFLEV